MNTQVRVSAKINTHNGEITHIRTVTEAEPKQREILNALGFPRIPITKEVITC